MLKTIIAAYREAFSGLPRSIWTLAAVTLVNRAGTMVLPFLVLYLTTDREFSTRGAGALLAVYGLGAMAGAYLGGWLTDRIGAIRVQGGSLLLTGVVFLLLSAAEATWALAAALAALGMVGEAFRPANAAALAELAAPALRIRAFALRRLAINVGMTFGPAVGGFLALIDYRWLFRVDAATCFAAALLLRVTVGNAKGRQVTVSSSEPGLLSAAPWRDPVFVAFLLLMMFLASVLFQFVSTLPLTLREHYGMSEDQIGLLFALNTLLIIAFEMILTVRLERRNPLRVLGIGALLTCLGFALLPLGSSYAWAMVTVAVWTVGEMFVAPMAEGFVAARAAPEARGRFMGLFVLSWSTAHVIAPLTGTLVYGRFGADTLWFGCGVVGVLLWLGFSVLSRYSQRRQRCSSTAAK